MLDKTMQKCAEDLLYALRPKEPVMAAEFKSYTVGQVAKILHTNTDRVYALIKSGELPSIKIGVTRIRHDVLLSFLMDHERNNTKGGMKQCP